MTTKTAKKTKEPAAKKAAKVKTPKAAKAAKTPVIAKPKSEDKLEAISLDESKKLIALEKQIETERAASNVAFQQIGKALKEINEGRLYRSEFPTFDAYCKAKWKLTRDSAYKFIEAFKTLAVLAISDVTKDLPAPASESSLRPLAGLPASQQAKAYKEAVEKADGKPPTAAQVKQAAAPAIAERKKVAKASRPKPFSEEALKTNKPLSQAFERMGKLFSPALVKAIREETLELTKTEVIEWMGLKDDKAKELEPLVVANRWPFKKAMRFIGTMPGDQSTVAELLTYAKIHGGKYEMEIKGYKIVVTNSKK